MSVKRILSSFMAFIMFMLIIPQAALAEEYVSLKDLANANGYEYFWYEDSETVNVRSASYILSFQNGNNMVGYKTVLDDQGTITLNYSAQLEGTDTLYVSKLDAQTKLIKYFPNTPDNSIETDTTDSSNSTGMPSDWAVSEINTAINNGLVTVNVQKDYKTDITREFFCELVMKLYEKITGESTAVGSNPFNDTNNTEVVKAYKLGIVNGISSDEFAPNSNITRQEICTMLVRAIGVMYPNIDLNDYTRHSFADSANIASWAMDSVQFAYDNDIMQGIGNNSINPLGHATCEQAILLVNRIYENRQTFEDRNEKSEAVIETLQTLEFDDDSEVKSVSVSFADGSDTSDVRIRESDEDDLINTTTGIKGRAVNITSGKDFDKATISFEYNPNGLGGSDPNDLAVAWYNTDLERIEVLESQVNTSDHTVSIETTHFSEYVLVDSKEWYEVWQMGQTIIRETDADGNYAENFNVQLVMDCSGSMSGDMVSRSQQVIYDFIGNLADDDKFSVIHFGDRASTVLSCSRKGDADMEQVRQNVMTKQASGGTYYSNALQECRNNIDYDDPDYTSIIVFLTDGEPSNTDYDDLLNEFADHNVRIAAVGVETETQELKHLAEATNGQCLYAYSTESLDLLYASIQGSLMGVEATDTDGDGIPDVIEMTGMKTRYGTIIKTDPNKWDTDGDGLSDSEEMGKLIDDGEPTEMDRARGIVQCVYYEYLSDPVEGHEVSNMVDSEIIIPSIHEEFINDHIAIISNDISGYNLCRINDGFAGIFAKECKDKGITAMYGAWDAITALATVFSDFKVDNTNDYDLLLRQLVLCNENVVGISETIENKYIDNIQAILGELSKASDMDVAQNISYAITDLSTYTVREMFGHNSKFAQHVNKIPYKRMQTAISECAGVLDSIGEVMGFVNYLDEQRCTAQELINFVALSSAYGMVQAEFEQVLLQIAANIKYMGTMDDYGDLENAFLLAESIEIFVNDMRAMKFEPINAFAEAVNDTSNELNENTIRFGMQAFFSDVCPNLSMVFGAASAGVTISNMLFDHDESALYVGLIAKCAVFAHAINQVIDEQEQLLLKNRSYDNALMLDQAFKMYKNIQLFAYNYAIRYENLAMEHAFLGMDDFERESWIYNANTEKIELENTSCH